MKAICSHCNCYEIIPAKGIIGTITTNSDTEGFIEYEQSIAIQLCSSCVDIYEVIHPGKINIFVVYNWCLWKIWRRKLKS